MRCLGDCDSLWLMKAVDTHVHLDFPQYDPDRSELLARLEEEEIAVINISTSLESIRKVTELATNNPLVWGAVGLHPTDVDRNTLVQVPQLLDEWKKLLQKNHKIVAIGEVGLDYYRNSHPATIQIAALRQILTLAQEVKKPVIFHCRDAYGDLLTILKDYPGVRGVIHCYNGNMEQARQFLDLDFYLSFTGMLTYKANEQLRSIAVAVPIERLLLETDSPFLAPQSKRGTRNNPFSIYEIAKQHAQLRDISEEEVVRQATANAVNLFSLRGM
jgi:TatD DNase family protein